MSFDRRLGYGDNVGSEQSSRSEQSLHLPAELEKLYRLIQPRLVKLVDERIELAQEKRLASIERNSENDIRIREQIFELRFSNKISQSIFTNEAIKGEESECIQIALFDGHTGNIVTSGPDASAKVEIVLLKGDLDVVEGFANMIEGRKSLLMGNLYIYLKQGIGSLDGIYFKHNSTWMKKCKFRLGARVVSNDNGIRVKEAMTEPFIVMDRRNKLYKKRHHPSVCDYVWRLKNISREGKFHKRLREANINTVQEFRGLLNLDPSNLRTILGKGMNNKKWEDTVKHAKTSCGGLYTDMLSVTEKADGHNLAISESEHQNKIADFHNCLIGGSSLEIDIIPPNNTIGVVTDVSSGSGSNQDEYFWEGVDDYLANYCPSVDIKAQKAQMRWIVLFIVLRYARKLKKLR